MEKPKFPQSEDEPRPPEGGSEGEGKRPESERLPDDAELWTEYQSLDRQIRDQIAGDRLQAQQEIFDLTEGPVGEFADYLEEIEPIPELAPYQKQAERLTGLET